ncbi:unnamed protein product [Lactuca virosa]|uniref:Glutathione S-transferase n=1 Tax=Lactuca virosa TaxID=75947 RepID=A0AAU9P4P0_9ASTR|nr:unnamed protein product [Lactuca virosa]
MVTEELVFVNFWSSPFGCRVKIALEEKGIPYEYKEEDLFNKSPLLSTINPVYNKVPVLVHNGKSICESLNIVEYIDEVWSDRSTSFLPSDPYERSQARFWADFIDKELYEASKKIYRCKGEEQESGKKDVLRILKLIEGELGNKPFIGGDNLGIEEECPILVSWAKRCSQKESVAKSLVDPIKIYDFILYLNNYLTK